MNVDMEIIILQDIPLETIAMALSALENKFSHPGMKSVCTHRTNPVLPDFSRLSTIDVRRPNSDSQLFFVHNVARSTSGISSTIDEFLELGLRCGPHTPMTVISVNTHPSNIEDRNKTLTALLRVFGGFIKNHNPKIEGRWLYVKSE